MISENIEHRIEALSFKAKKLLLLKLKDAITRNSAENSSNRKRIVAYVQGNEDFSFDELKTDLQQKLPDYMVPSEFVSVAKMPLLPNGKINRKVLQSVKSPKVISTKKIATNTVEAQLIKIWEEVLGFSPINKDDNFFEIGGDSILSIQIIAKARKNGLVLESNTLFEYQTIAELANLAKVEKKEEHSSEEILLKIWEETLGFAPIHKDDNFFEIGGDSILSIQIIAKARKQGLVLQANDLFEHQTIAALSNIAKMKQKEEVSSEKILLKIWEETLGFAPIHKDDNFFEIGGDSILSIQIIAKARKQGLVIKPNDLFEHQTVAQLSSVVKIATKVKNSELVIGFVPLSPIQEWFFKDHKNAPEYWNQGVRLDNLPSTSEEKIAVICEYLITQHDVLRAKFSYKENKWIQEICTPKQTCALQFVDLSKISSEQIENIVLEQTQTIQKNFNLSKGSLFKCIYFGNSATSKDFCIFISHHLVIDAVSWQIVIDDFKNALQEVSANKTISKETKTSSFKDWTKYLSSYAENISKEELTFWKAQITEVSKLPIDKENTTIIEEKDISQLLFSFNETITKTLIEANKAYNTKTEELLIAAFIEVVGNWSKNEEIAIGFERHGRETAGSDLDVSKTVGWFTSYFPVKFAFQALNSIDNKIIATKEKLRSIPNGGIGYGALRYLKNVFGEKENPEIVFNFLGTQTNSQSKNAVKTTTISKNLRDPKSERHYKLEVNLSIVDNILKGSFSFGKNVHETETMTILMNAFKNQVQEICTHCNQVKKGRYTPSDFSEAEISQDDLDNLIDFLD